jgi:hypothetical protein
MYISDNMKYMYQHCDVNWHNVQCMFVTLPKRSKQDKAEERTSKYSRCFIDPHPVDCCTVQVHSNPLRSQLDMMLL